MNPASSWQIKDSCIYMEILMRACTCLIKCQVWSWNMIVCFVIISVNFHWKRTTKTGIHLTPAVARQPIVNVTFILHIYGAAFILSYTWKIPFCYSTCFIRKTTKYKDTNFAKDYPHRCNLCTTYPSITESDKFTGTYLFSL